MTAPLDCLAADDFAPHVGSAFRSLAPPLDLQLTAIEPAGTGSFPGRAPFSLFFHGPRVPLLAQKIYALEHPALGRLEIFLVPIGLEGEGVRYQAVFS